MLVFNGLCALVDVAIPLFQRYAIRNFIQADSLRGIVPFSLVYLLVILLQALSVVAFARNSMTIRDEYGPGICAAPCSTLSRPCPSPSIT